MRHTFIVTVETDDTDLDAPSAETIANEIYSNLNYDDMVRTIGNVDIRTIKHNYREQIISGGLE